MNRKDRINVLFIVFFMFVFQNVCADIKEHNILVLHSYHQGLEWTDNISAGIQEVFKDRTDINLIFEYLDAKRNFNQEYYKELYDLYKVKAKQIPFDLILISDNAAFDFMKKHKTEFYPDIPVLFCGVNNLDTVAVKNTLNCLGTGERADHFGTLLAIEKVFPQRKNVLIVNDNTLTGKNIRNEIDQVLQLFEGRLNFEFESDFTMGSLQEKVKSLDDSYVIYLLVINRDMNGKFISYKKGISKIKEVSQVPVFGSWEFYEGKGMIGGKIIRGREQGKYIAEIAKKIIDGASINDFPKYIFLENSYVFDYNEMTQFGVSKDLLPEGSIIINKPSWKDTMLRVTIIIILLLLVVSMFLMVRLRIKRKRSLEMESIIRKRTVELKEINKELSDIIIAKDKFFSILAHDLRGSVSVFQSYSILLNQKAYAQNPEKSSKIRENLQMAANQTYGIVEDLLYWGYNQFKHNQKIDSSDFNIAEVINGILEKLKLNLNDVSFNTEYDHDLVLRSDKNVCAFICRNIIQNSIKFSKIGGVIEVRTKKTKEGVLISIKDYGIGMSQEIVNSIYKKQPVKREGLRGQKSMGMGLVTVLEYLELIGGTLEIVSKPDKGSEFIIKLNN